MTEAKNFEDIFTILVMISIPYWILVLAGLWVFEGFKEDKKVNR